MKSNNLLSIIMPFYNTEKIDIHIKQAIKELKNLSIPFEIILSNDGSDKKYLISAKNVKDKRIKIVGYEKNKGKGYAIKYAVQYAKGNYIAFLDAGGDINARQLENFLRTLSENNADIVIGSKRHPESKVRYPLTRKLMSSIYQLLNRFLFGLKVKDTQVGIKLFKRPILNKIISKVAIKRFAFDLELLVIATKLKAKIIEAPIEIKYQFNSTINPKAVFWMLWDTLAIFYRDRILKHYD